uniref:S9 family peptidase n=1 Tax=Xanthomonas vasicola pv. vasculorum NCPPB 890 TaxID=1184265 RepID=A0A836P1K3_XANVA
MLPLTLLLLATAVHAQSAAPLTIEQAMADPDWIGPSVDQAWWQWDGKQVQYLLKRDGSPVRDTYRQSTGGGTAERVADTARAGLDAANPSYDATRQRMLFARNGDIFLRDLRTGALTQLTRSNEIESHPQFASDGGAIWRAGNTRHSC